MLWQKEKNSNIYVDLLGSESYPLSNLRLNRTKSDTISSKLRSSGNDKYHEKDIKSAMYLYNESIGFAQSSKNLSLGYANRSSCFFAMGMYNQCLLDIQLARDAGYPERSMAKLQSREDICKKSLQAQPQPTSNDSLSDFEPNCELPSMGNSLIIENSSKYGKLVAAKRDIHIGETLFVEEPYIDIVYNKDMKECSTCGKENMNFIPCQNCADTMYCSSECGNNNFHDVECDMTMHSVDHVVGESSLFLLRSIIIAINTYSTIHELMDEVQSFNATASGELCQSITLPQERYETFFKLSSVVSKQRILDYREKAFIIFHAIVNSSIRSKFSSTEEKRFLFHLIIHHGLILRSNAFQRESGDDFEMKINLITSYINHSCIPNVTVLHKHNTTVVKSILPIKKGEQLFILYMVNDDFEGSLTGVNEKLERIYGFRCECFICEKGKLMRCNTHSREQSESFSYIETNITKLRECFDSNLLIDLKNHAKDFLLKNFSITGSKEYSFVSSCLCELFQMELNV